MLSKPRSAPRYGLPDEIDVFERRTVNAPRKVSRTEHLRDDTRQRVSRCIDHI
ncbi:uncharacterized protein HfgLR_23335 (plasmid) [Haloferax gibbonsii]|uniref:Uncharacterized protein n=1 Tax=Haloferax gibbonsii TaxID=35746 RepID=A0A871BLF9_HALGI|nr:uncharacterized protein HfgLR_23335 [Haloferax gibbonsii]